MTRGENCSSHKLLEQEFVHKQGEEVRVICTVVEFENLSKNLYLAKFTWLHTEISDGM